VKVLGADLLLVLTDSGFFADSYLAAIYFCLWFDVTIERENGFD